MSPRVAAFALSVVFVGLAAPVLASAGRGDIRLVLPDPIIRSGRPLEVRVVEVDSNRGAAVLGSRRGGPSEWPGLGILLCLGPPLSERNVLARGRADLDGVARFRLVGPGWTAPDGVRAFMQAAGRDEDQPGGVGVSPSRAIPVVPDALWLADGSGQQVLKVDAATGVVLGAYPVPGRPLRIQHDFENARIVILVSSSPSRLAVLDARDARETALIEFDPGFAPDSFALAERGTRAIVVESSTGRVASVPLFEPDSLVMTSLPDGFFPTAGVVSARTAEGEVAFFPHALRLTVAVADAGTLSVIETIDLDPERTIDPAEQGTFVTWRGSAVGEIDGVSRSLLIAPLLLHSARAVLVSVDLSRRPFDASLSSGSFSTLGPIAGLVATPGGYAYALDAAGETLVAFRTQATLDVLSATPVPRATVGIVRTDVERIVVATDIGHAAISIVDPAAPLVFGPVVSVGGPDDIAP